MKYRGSRHPTTGAIKVYIVEGEQVFPLEVEYSQRIYNHSPDGFEWGFSGSGPAQLALAILLNYFKDEPFALAHYQTFKEIVVCRLPKHIWQIDAVELESFRSCVSFGNEREAYQALKDYWCKKFRKQ